MKTVEEILGNFGIGVNIKFGKYKGLYETLKNMVEQTQKEAYNQALEDVAKSIKLKRYSLSPYDDTSDGYDLRESSISPLYTRDFNGFINGKVEIDKESILKLKK